jgi:hypothetical protein
MDKELIPIGEAAKKLNVSIDTLRRWDAAGNLKSVRATSGGNRYYKSIDIDLFSSDLLAVAIEWVKGQVPKDIDPIFHCADASVFKGRLDKLEHSLKSTLGLENDFSLISSIVGEIGNNSFDHNIGQWLDIKGILFAYDLNKRQIVLADRGQGILTTLKRVKSDLSSDADALYVAFTKKISGRAPESRGNGLKFVKLVVTELKKSISMELYFQTGEAALNLGEGDKEIEIFYPDFAFRGCLAFIKY